MAKTVVGGEGSLKFSWISRAQAKRDKRDWACGKSSGVAWVKTMMTFDQKEGVKRDW